MSLGGGYQEPTGVLLRNGADAVFALINFSNSTYNTTEHLLSLNTVAKFNSDGNLTQSALRFKYYHYDEWNSQLASLSGQGVNIASGMLDWMRSEEPFYWYYYDLGNSGNFTRSLEKSVSFPYDDITTIPVGQEPLNYSFPLINSSGGRIKESSSLLLPFYQSAGMIEQVQASFSGMFANPITNSAHILDTTISGVPVPQIPQNIALQLNNLNVKPSGFISEYGDFKTPLSFPFNIIPGSGFQPILDMAQQVNYPREYIANINAIIPFQFAPTPQPTTNCTSFGDIGINKNKADYWISQLHFGFMQPSSLSIQFSGVMPIYTFAGNEYDRFGNSRQALTILAYPTISVELHSYGGIDVGYPGYSDNTIFSFNLGAGNVYTINTSGIQYTIGVTGAIIHGTSNALLGYNSFSRYYDPLADGNSDNSDSLNIPTTNFYLKHNSGWLLDYKAGNVCLNTSNVYIPSVPDLNLNADSLNLTINNIDVPVTKYENARISGVRTLNSDNSLPQACFPVIGGTATITYTMPAILCKGYNYLIGQAFSNPGTTNGSMNCTQFDPMLGFVNICKNESFYRASRFGNCCVTAFKGVCTNVNDIYAAFFVGNCSAPIPTPTECFTGFAPGLAQIDLINGCGENLKRYFVAGALPSVYNQWVDVTQTVELAAAGGFLNDYQDMTIKLTLTGEAECISLRLSQDAVGFYTGCFKNYPAGQPIDFHDGIDGSHNADGSSTYHDSNDLTIFDMINGGTCSWLPPLDNGGSGPCTPKGYISTLEGKNVTVNVVFDLIVQCPDGSTTHVGFSAGVGGSYPACPITGCGSFNCQTAEFTADVGSAPAGCGWW